MKKMTMKESRVLKRVQQGEEIAVDLLQHLVGTAGLDMTRVFPLFVHETSIHKKLYANLGRSVGPRDGWSMYLTPRPDPQVDSELATHVPALVEMAPDKVPVMICAGDKFVLMGVPAAILLPPSKLGPVKEAADGESFRTLRDQFYLYYLTDEDSVEGTAGRRLRRLQEAVRGAVAAELARKGTKRPLVDIVFEVVGGPALEARIRASGQLCDTDIHEALDAIVAS